MGTRAQPAVRILAVLLLTRCPPPSAGRLHILALQRAGEAVLHGGGGVQGAEQLLLLLLLLLCCWLLQALCMRAARNSCSHAMPRAAAASCSNTSALLLSCATCPDRSTWPLARGWMPAWRH